MRSIKFTYLFTLIALTLTSLFVFADPTVADAPDASQAAIASSIAQFIGFILTMLASTAWGTKITGIILLLIGLTGTASVVVKLFEKVAQITPSTKDDEYAHWLAKGFSWVTWVLAAVALNPKVQDANKSQEGK